LKTKILIGVLCVSALLNVAGLIFFIRYLQIEHSYRSVKRERNTIAQNLAATRATEIANNVMESGQVTEHTFVSIADGTTDTYALLPPQHPEQLDNTLIVYLHGMGSNILEPFAAPATKTIAQAIQGKYPNACILAPSYRKDASWGSDPALSDITQNIRCVMQQYPFKRIILMGTSMGGCTALLYATEAPPDIRQKLTGIVSVEGAGNLADLAATTEAANVRWAIQVAMGGDAKQVPAQYARKSFIPNIEKLSPAVRVAVVSASRDKVVKPELQQRIVSVLQEHSNGVKMISVDGTHGAPPAPYYIEALDFTLGSS
jgi:pimeloyl-ACP methyl ester carboxylesterase